jgi:hypothetical protein
MAAKKISHLPSATQGLVRYISQEASNISLSNMLLQRLNAASLLHEDLAKTQDRLARARAEELFIEFMISSKTPRHSTSESPKERRACIEQPQAVIEATQLGPFFHSREEALAIRRHQTVTERNLWALYYERYGCVRCDGKDKPHQSNGLCANCHQTIVVRRKGLLDGKRKYGEFGV